MGYMFAFGFIILFIYYLILVADVLIQDWVHLMTQMWKWFSVGFSTVVMECTE